MKTYDIFLFDADHTLYDFDKAEKYALQATFEACGFPYDQVVYTQYKEINDSVWSAYEKGELGGDDFPSIRFTRLFQEFEITYDAKVFDIQYLTELGNASFLLDGAVEICQQITAKEKPIFIITNGIQATQESRIKHSLIHPYIAQVFISAAIGYQKPDYRFFEYVLAHIPPINKEQILIVGDSLSADIAGGNNIGIDTCWFNPQGAKISPTKHTSLNTPIKPTYEINCLQQITHFI